MRDIKFKIDGPRDHATQNIENHFHDQSGSTPKDLGELVDIVQSLRTQVADDPELPAKERKRIERHLETILDEAGDDSQPSTLDEIKTAATAIGSILKRVGKVGAALLAGFGRLSQFLGL